MPPSAPAARIPRTLVHASAVALGGVGILIRGPSGSGKSDLALALVDGGAKLIADDQVAVERHDGALAVCWPAEAPETLRGRLEVRGVGILPVPHVSMAPLGLVVDLDPASRIERLPEPKTLRLLNVSIPAIAIDGHGANAAAKVRLAAHALARVIIPPS
jgi:serine kinase of HPr protein (carbohydrate metabolism regulator)